MGGSYQALAAALAVSAYAYLLERVRAAHLVRTFRGAEEPWWFGYYRDAVSLIGAVGFVVTHHLAGYPDHLALLLGCLATLVEWGIHEVLAEKLRVRTVFLSTVIASYAAVIYPILAPAVVGPWLDRLLAALF